MIKQTSEYVGPLAGLNVIDFGHYYAGPMAAMNLADQGANVIHINRPGDPLRPERELYEQQHRLLNRNKKLLTLDLKTEQGKAQVLSLVEKADVVIENFRPGVMKRLGLDYASVKGCNPGLVYLSLPGFASTDKERAHIQAWEGVLSAASGVYTESYWVQRMLKFPPSYTWVPQCSAYGAVQGVIAVMAALLAREEKGFGTVIEVPLVDAGLSGFSSALALRALYPDVSPLKPLEYASEDNQKIKAEKIEKGHKAFGLAVVKSPLYTFWPCADGRHILIWGGTNPLFNQRFFKSLNIDKKLKSEGFIIEAGTKLDNNICAGPLLNEKCRQRLMHVVGEALLTKTAEEWDEIFGHVGLPCALIRTRKEWLELEPMLKSGVLTKMDNGKSVLTVPGRMVDVSGVGNDGKEQILINNGYREASAITAAQAIEWFSHRVPQNAPKGKPTPLKKGDLLKGLKVLDFANIVAGPASSYNLAQYGAEVIKIDPPQSFDGPLVIEINQGKRSLLADLRTGPGQDLLHKLVSWADVVIHNSLDDAACRLGLTHARLQAINPKVVSCQLSAYGGTYRGGWEVRKGFDPVAPASTGLMASLGTLKQPQLHGGMSAADMNSGLGLAFSALLSVYQHRKTGYAGEGRTSLVRSNNHFQLPFMIADNGRTDWGETDGPFAVGDYWWQRLYACNDGWIYISAREDQADLLAQKVTGERNSDVQTLETRFAAQDCQHWFSILDAKGIACHRVLSVEDIHAQSLRKVGNEAADEKSEGPLEVLCWNDHPSGTPLTLMAPTWVRVGEDFSYKRLTPTPSYGEHTTEILREFGYREDEINELLRYAVVQENPLPF